MLPKLHFTLLLLWGYRKKHGAIFLLSIFLVFLVSSVLFISSSLQQATFESLEQQADFTIERYKGGRVQEIPQEWLDQFLNISGVTQAQGRVYGTHFYESKEHYFFIVGVDFYDEQIVKNLKLLVKDLDVEDFLSKKQMIIGEGVKEFLDDLHYFKYYTFRPPDKSKEKVYIYNKFPHATSLLTNDMVIMDVALARKILGIPQGYFSDIILKVPNKKEHQMVYEKLFLTHFDMRIITKEDIAKHFKKLFNTKGGVFLILYIVVLVSFLLLLYQRYSMVGSGEKKEIALLRSVGWRIEQVLWLKVVENGIIALSAFLLGVIFAYMYVFFADAPLLRDIFLGTNNFSAHLSLYPVIHLGDIALLFAFFVIPFLVAVVVPLWRLSITDISEVLR